MSDVFHFVRRQIAGEQKSYSPDFLQLIPVGASLTGASTAYTQLYGGSMSGSAQTSIDATGTIVTFLTPALSPAGLYRFTVTATVSDGQVRKALYDIRVDA